MKNIVTILFLFFSLISQATNYYVKNSGSDAANGLTTATAWATINKVNGSSFSAGDSILFNRGDTWRETLIVPSSGSSGSRIVFSAYGTGADPIINGSTNITTWDQDNIGGTAASNDLLSESFEGVGYDDGSWSEGVGVNEGNIIDQDNTAVARPTGGGDQVLKTVKDITPTGTSAASMARTIRTFGSEQNIAYIDFYVMINAQGLTTTSDEVRLFSGANSSWQGTSYLYLFRDAQANIKFRMAAYNNGGEAFAVYPVSGSMTLDQWYHIQIKYDITNAVYAGYIDGTLVLSGSLTGTLRGGTKMILVGDGDNAKTLTAYFDLVNLSSTNFYIPSTPLPANVWKSAVASAPNSVWFLEGVIKKWGVQKATVDDLTDEYDWCYTLTDELAVYSTADPATTYDAVESAIRSIGIDINTKDYIQIENLEVAYIRDFGIRIQNGGDYNIIDNTNVHHIGAIEVPIQEGIIISGSYNTVKNSSISQCGRHGVFIDINGVESCSNNIIEHNEIFDNYYTGLDFKNLGSGTSTNHIARYNKFYCSSDGSYADPTTSCEAIWLGNGTHSNILIHHNLIYNMMGTGISMGDGCSYIYVYNNTVFGKNALNTGDNYASGITIDGDYIYVKNNIAANVRDVCFVSNTVTHAYVDYNCWYQAAPLEDNRFTNFNGTGYRAADFATYKVASGFDTNSFWESPSLVNSSNSDFHIQAGSPCINAGINVGLTSDYDGNPIVGIPDIGAYEFGVPSPIFYNGSPIFHNGVIITY